MSQLGLAPQKRFFNIIFKFTLKILQKIFSRKNVGVRIFFLE